MVKRAKSKRVIPKDIAMDGKRKHFIARITLLIVLLTTLASFLMWQNIKGLSLNKELNAAKNEQLRLQKEYYKNKVEYERLRKKESVVKNAKKLLKMEKTKRRDFRLSGLKDKEKLIEELINTEGTETREGTREETREGTRAGTRAGTNEDKE